MIDKTIPIMHDYKHLMVFEIITDFHLEARYPDEKFSFYKRCTQEFTEHYLKEIEETMRWLRRLIPSSTP